MVNWKKYRFFLLNLLLILSCITKNIVESSQIEHLIFKIPSSNFTLMKLCASLLVSIFNILYVFDFLTPYLDVETNIKIRKKEKYYYLYLKN
ncbi:membrane protein [Erysipelothrix rhusiopathiae]|nr:membrane protein [Erysipelothrix rhusiopathiae]